MGEMRLLTAANPALMREAVERAGAESLVVDGIKPGDTKIIWNPENEDEVASARRTWDELVGKKRFLAFRVGSGGRKGEQIREFDPTAEKLIIAPPMAGGQEG